MKRYKGKSKVCYLDSNDDLDSYVNRMAYLCYKGFKLMYHDIAVNINILRRDGLA